ncbi:MAG: general secretion pathway protein GspK [Bdellovibrionaceae bacterium]|nr:general secretion pathway protein GspK [Bdellovibrionales bacterium]MCB9082903.1 general secretion pathway protein GspK [Pseudobdellovibrionaceae bacterium]
MMMALFVMMILTFLATEVAFRTGIENNIAVQGISRLRAYYAAKAGLELSLFRILLYKKAMASFGEQLGENKSMLDPIWQFPFVWPPVLPDEISGVDKSQIQAAVKESKMDASYAVTIESEGGKIDINDLGSDSEALVKATKDQILQIFQVEVENNEQFAEKYGTFNFEDLVHHMIDWVDENSESLVGGDERNYYQDVRSEFIPPNAPFKTLNELHMVAEMTDDLYQVLARQVTVYGSKGVNVNYSDKHVLKSLDVQMTDEVVTKVIERRSSPQEGGPFRNYDDFLDFLGTQGVRTDSFNPAGIPLVFDAELNFRIKSVGSYGRVTREIEVVTYDFDNIKERYIDILTKAEEEKKGEGGGDPGTANKGDGKSDDKGKTTPTAKKLNAPKGRPTVVYWYEN